MIWFLAMLACSADLSAGHRVALLDPVVSESSGLVRADDVSLWTHGDSGNAPVLFRVGLDGRVVQTVEVTGATSVDWEDLAADGAGNLWLGDIGNNSSTRTDLAVHRVPVPAATASTVAVTASVSFTYPDQVVGSGEQAFDAEALFFDRGRLYLLSKRRSDQSTRLYRFPRVQGTVVLEELGTRALGGDPDRYGGLATAADLSADGRRLALLTYHAIFVFDRPAEGAGWLAGEPVVISLDQDVAGQCEGLAWLGGDLLFTNEGRALFRLGADHLKTSGSWP